jgi:uncharacterized protein involved in exopolysaccharide biosynthesis
VLAGSATPGLPQGNTLDLETARNFLTILFKWKWLILGCCLAVALPIAIVTLSRPTLYVSVSKVILKSERADTAITAGERERLQSDIDYRRGIENAINTEIQIIRSRDVLQKAYKVLQLPAENLNVFSNLNVTPIKDSNIIQVAVTYTDPEVAVRAVNALVDAYQERHTMIHRPAGAFQFFEKQVVLYAKQLAEANRQLNQFQTSMGGADLEKLLAQAQKRVAGLEEEYQQVEITLEGARKRLAFLNQEIAKQPVRITTIQNLGINPVNTDLERRLVQLRLEKKALLQLYTEKDRRVIAKNEEIKAAQTALAGQDLHMEGTETTGLNPLRRTLENDLLTTKSTLRELSAKRKVLQDQLQEQRALLPQLNQQVLEYNRLTEDVKLNRRNYDLYERKREESRISQAMDREKLINVGILERPALPLPTVRRRRSLSLLLAVATGLVLGTGLAMAIEFFNATFKHEREVEKYLDLPVLASIERFRV